MATDINKLLLIVSHKWETKGKFYADACAITKFHSKAVAGVEEDTTTEHYVVCYTIITNVIADVTKLAAPPLPQLTASPKLSTR